MFVEFFIKRPIFAAVCALVIVIAGAISIPNLPLAQYPEIAPPRVTVSTNYIGASAQVVESAVTTLLEQQINGITQAKYINSTSGNDGTCSINITFDLERDLDLAAVDVQTRVANVQGRLPDEVRRVGVGVEKVSSAFLVAIGIGDRTGKYSTEFLSNYSDVYIKDALKRVKGVGDVIIFGERKYSMRIWLDPHRMAEQKITAEDVVNCVREQNVQVSAGQIGSPPTPSDHLYQMSVRVAGRLKTAEEFNNLIVKIGNDGRIVRLRDVGRAELGAEDYQTVVRYRGFDTVGIGVMQRPGSNALEVVQNVRKEMDRISKRFPPGLQYEYAFDTTLAVQESIHEVMLTMSQAILLVVLTIFLFLQRWRTTLIPLFTIPVSLIGTFGCMHLLGFSINTLTLFGMVLATGLVVDDAIVVIENISRFINEKKMNAFQAARAAMKEVAGAVIAISLVLVAVFVPVAFFPGTTGQLYKQFALTIACSVSISAFAALTLTPALSALWLKGESDQIQNPFFTAFNSVINHVRNGYTASLKWAIRLRYLTLCFFIATIAATYWLFQVVPSSFLPNEDLGYFITIVQGPEGVSLNYTKRVLQKIEKELDKVPEISSTFGVAGFSFAGNKPSNGILFSSLKPWHERKGPGQSLDAVINRLRVPMSQITDAMVIPFAPPSIEGLGAFGGFVLKVQDMDGSDINQLAKVTQEICREANQQPELAGVFSGFAANSPQILVDVNRDKAKTLRVSLSDIFSTLQAFLGSYYVNDIDIGTRVYRVYVQADPKHRSNPSDIQQFYVRSADGTMVPLSNLITMKTVSAPQTIDHYNLFRATEINGATKPGYSSGQAMAAMERVLKKVLPSSMTYAWSGISQEQLEAGSKSIILFALGLTFVFLVLAAQYESFTDPVVILVSVPTALFGAMLAQFARGLENDVFCQIGLVMLIGLVCKNAILIVEFANQLRDTGLSAREAVVQAAAIRLRPILMTTFAFVMGIMPLVFATGAGANSRHSLGTAVCGGMIVSSVLSLYVVPVMYVLKDSLMRRLRGDDKPQGKGKKQSKDGVIEVDVENVSPPEDAIAFRRSEGYSANQELSGQQ